MKTIGILGGMSWESSAVYYRLLNEGVRGDGHHRSAHCILYSVDFEPFQRWQHEGRWDAIADELAAAARRLQAAGADYILLATNSMHKVADEVQAAVDVPLLHIVDIIAEQCHARGIKRIGLLATAFTMEQDFYKGRLQQRHGIEVLIPPPPERAEVHRVIYEELCRGIIRQESKQYYLRTLRALADAGADAVLLGCTEIGLLVSSADTDVPLLDSTVLHVEHALRHAQASAQE